MMIMMMMMMMMMILPQDLEVARQSVGALANLSEDTKTHKAVATCGGGKVMITLMKHEVRP
jgi:hypothetical protein